MVGGLIGSAVHIDLEIVDFALTALFLYMIVMQVRNHLSLLISLVSAVLAVIFFVIKNAYANWRVRERVAPSRANASGWFLFLGLLMVATMAVLAVINSGQFLAPLYLAPLGGVAAISLVAWLMTFSAKR